MNKQERESRKKRRKRKVLLALLLVLFTGVILTASTYAWFTSNKNISVESIDVKVTAANGIQVSTDAINWKTTITNADLTATLADGFTYSSNTNQLPLKSSNAQVIPVSTGKTVSGGKLNMYAGELGNNALGEPVLTTTKSTESKRAGGDFVAFDLFFSVTQNSVVKLGKNSSVTTATGGTDKGLKNAARVAWLNLGNVAPGSAASAAQALSSGTEVKIWEPNNNEHTTSAVADALSTYGQTITTSAQVASYYGVDAEMTGVSLKNLSSGTIGTNFKSVTPDLKTPTGPTTADNTWFTLNAGVTKVRFYLWIEGQDYDCENNASGDSISYLMNFVLAD